jgi:hypothetical protein
MNAEFETEKRITFLKDLNESRLIPSSSHMSKYSLRDIVDAIFLYFIVLYILKQEVEYAPIVHKYIDRSYINSDFDNFMVGTTDLRIFLTALFGGNDDINNRLSEQEANEILRKRIIVDHTDIIKYLRSIQNPHLNSQEARLLYNFEKDFLITTSNYRSVRRLAVEWSELKTNDKKLVITRLLQAFRTRFRKSELLPYLEQLSKKDNLEIKNVINAETGEEPKEKKHIGKDFLKYLGMTLAGMAVGTAVGLSRSKKKD